MSKTYQITSTHFAASITINKFGVVTHASPPLEFMVGWYKGRMTIHVEKKAWRVAELKPHAQPEGDRVTG